MIFGSFEFFIFFSATFLLWITVRSDFRWLTLLAASYFFYCTWKPWYAGILVACTLITWLLAIKIAVLNDAVVRKQLLWLSVVLNLTPLFFFKYYNFFSASLEDIFPFPVVAYSLPQLEILLPVGISFYTFQAISYCTDVYRGKLEPERHIGIFALYLSFFPKLISGPIERGASLLPQLRKATIFSPSLFYSGVQLFFWGLCKKVVIADRLGMYVDMVFGNPQDYWGKTVIIAAWLFALQIYCDFSAYMNMAIGCGRIFGIELSQNFNFPYMARTIADFWRRWHITLTSWFRDYVYIAMGGNRLSPANWALNIMLVFLLSGLWHGAAWTFVIWGGLHGFYYLFGKLTAPARSRASAIFGVRGNVLAVVQVLVTFNLVALAWIFFRARSVQDAFVLLSHMVVNFDLPVRMMSSQFSTALSFGMALLFICLELFLYWDQKNNFRWLLSVPNVVRYPAYAFCLLLISLLGVSTNKFIYFHF